LAKHTQVALGQTSARGQKRRLGGRAASSGLPRSTDILSARRHVSKVPISELGALWRRATRSCAGRRRVANRAWQRPVERTAQRAVLTKPFIQDLNQTLICAVPQWGRTARIPWLCIGTRMRRTMVRRSIHNS